MTDNNKQFTFNLLKLQDFFSSMNEPVFILNKKLNILFINPSAENLTGFSNNETNGSKIFFLFDMDDSSDIEKILSLNNINIKKKNGDITKVTIASVFSETDDLKIFLLNRLEKDKKFSSNLEIQMLYQAIENSPATVVITDSSGKIEYVNPKFSRLTGYSFDEAIGKNPSVLKSGTQGVDFYKDLWDTILSGNEWRGEFHNKKKDGSLYWEFASISPIRNSNNEITNFVAVKEDVTERKIAEDKLRISEEKLRQKNQSMQQDLNYAQVIIKDILPSEAPKWERLKVEFRYIPLDVIGGDFFWFYNLADGTPAVYLGDVSGHGVSAALFLSMVKAVSDGLLPKYGYNPGKYIHALNRDLYNNMFSYFLTALYGVFDFNSEGVNFSFSKGGHQPPIIYRKKEEKVFSISSKGKPIGMFDEDYFDEVSIELNKGDRVFLYTDGLVEASNESMEMLDQTGLENIIMTNYSSDLNKSLEYILAAVNNFMGTDKAQDDIILIAIELI